MVGEMGYVCARTFARHCRTALRPWFGVVFTIGMALTATLAIEMPAAQGQGARSWQSEGDRVRHVVVTLYKSRTFHLDQPFATAVVGSPDIADALPMSDRSLYIQGKKIGTTNVSVFDQKMRLIGRDRRRGLARYRNPAGEDPGEHRQPRHSGLVQ